MPAGRPSKIFMEIDKEKLRLADGKIIQFLRSEVKSFTSGAYIPVSTKYLNHSVFIIVLEKEVKLK